jgi:hypothetical protein
MSYCQETALDFAGLSLRDFQPGEPLKQSLSSASSDSTKSIVPRLFPKSDSPPTRRFCPPNRPGCGAWSECRSAGVRFKRAQKIPDHAASVRRGDGSRRTRSYRRLARSPGLGCSAQPPSHCRSQSPRRADARDRRLSRRHIDGVCSEAPAAYTVATRSIQLPLPLAAMDRVNAGIRALSGLSDLLMGVSIECRVVRDNAVRPG